VPDTIQEVLLARIDRLPPQEKRLLQAAAVIGKDVSFAILKVVAQLPEDALGRSLIHLKAAELLYETTLAPETEYTFKHVLTQEVAYGSILEDRRHALHARIVEAIEQLYPDRLAEHVERLAHHAFRGEVWGKALTFLRQAGAKTASRSAHREAVVYFEQALAALTLLPENRQTIEQAIDLRLDLRNSLHPLGEFERIIEYLREAERLAERLDDQHRLARVFAYMTQYFWWMGEPDRAIESGKRALVVATDVRDFSTQVLANFYLGFVYHSLGDYDQAIAVLEKNIESLKGDLTREPFGLPGLPFVFSRVWLIQCFAERGEFAEGIARGEECLQIAKATDHPFSLIQVHFGLGFLYLRKGEFDKAIQWLAEGLELCQRWNIPIYFSRIASCLGAAYALSGRAGYAVPLLEQAVKQAASMKMVVRHVLAVAWLSEVHLLDGRVDVATHHARSALALAREHKERGHEGWALRLLGEIASRSDPWALESAEDYYRQALALAEDRGMRPLVAHCHLGLGKLYQRTGDRSHAEEHLTAAIALFREMDMRSWWEESTTELNQLG